MADILNQFVGSMYNALISNIWDEFVRVIPGVIAAIIIVLIGWVLARIIKQIVIKVLQSTKIDQCIDEQNLTAAIGGKEISGLLGSLAKWYVLGIFLAQAVGWLQLETFKGYLERLFVFSAEAGGDPPIFFSLLGGIIVMVAGLLVARYFRNLIEATTFKLKKVLGLGAEAVVLIFAGILALTLVVGPEVTNIIVYLLNLFLAPFVWAFAIVLAVVVGVRVLVDWKDDLKSLSAELKKAFK